MNEEVLIGLIFIGLILSASFHGVMACILENFNCDVFYTPKTIYEKSNMNWFGSIMIYIILFPFCFVLAIGGFLKWLFTVGRR